MANRRCLLILMFFLEVFLAYGKYYGGLTVSTKNTNNGFIIFNNKKCAEILIDRNDFEVVKLSADFLKNDIKKLSKREINPIISSKLNKNSAIVIGTIGNNKFIDQLIKNGKIDISSIKEKWESFIITEINSDKQNGSKMLVIAGSDRRGTAFGVFTLSRLMGISPWYWWADVPVTKVNSIIINASNYTEGEPSVKYRGIFINDESNGLFPWAISTIDKRKGDLGPNTYSKIFELLLRLKANYCWPAMHSCTKGFNFFRENSQLADKYAIIMGSSHCEQMLRNNVSEWKSKTMGEWNYKTNRTNIYKYWENRIKTNFKYENTYTLGIRGEHDTSMKGASLMNEKVKYTQMAIDDQCRIISKYFKNANNVSQIFCAYKEVLDIYKNGLNVPDDVTLMWADDNHGFMKHLPNKEERKRSGGSGIYYHLSYFGDPEGWLWLSSMNPGVIAFELLKSYNTGANRIWMFNVGDIKPAEKEITLVLDMAWDINKWTTDNVNNFITSFINETFEKKYTKEMSEIMNEYYELSLYGKPEHVKFIDFTESEIEKRLNMSDDIIAKIKKLSERIPENLYSSYYQLIAYPALGTAFMNKYYLLAKLSLVKASEADNKALSFSEKARYYYNSIDSITDYYNSMNNGKWNKMMYWRPYKEIKPGFIMPMAKSQDIISDKSCITNQLIDLNNRSSNLPIEYIFNSDISKDETLWLESTSTIKHKSFTADINKLCKIAINDSLFQASALPIGNIWHATTIGPIWTRIGKINIRQGENHLKIQDFVADASISKIFIGQYPPLQDNIVWQIKSTDYTSVSTNGSIEVLKGFGQGNAIAVKHKNDTNDSLWVEYKVFIPKGCRTIEVHTLPTFNLNNDDSMKVGISINNNIPVYNNLSNEEFCAEWQKNVLRGYTVSKAYFTSDKETWARCKVFVNNENLVLMRIVIR